MTFYTLVLFMSFSAWVTLFVVIDIDKSVSIGVGILSLGPMIAVAAACAGVGSYAKARLAADPNAFD